MNKEKRGNLRNYIINHRAIRRGDVASKNVDPSLLYEAVEEIQKDVRELTTENKQLKVMCMNGILASKLDHDWNSIMATIRYKIEEIDCDKTKKELLSYLRLLHSKQSILGEMDSFSSDMGRNIYAKDIKTFLTGYYKRQDRYKKIEFNIDDDYKVYAQKSNFFGLLLNIFDNSFYWCNDKISISSKDGKLIIANDGESIKDDSLDSVFRIGYTKQIEGHGYGLSLSKEVNKHYVDVYATNDKELNIYNGACFVIDRKRT